MTIREPFRQNAWPTLGVELELQLVDAHTMALRSAIGEVLASLPRELHGSVKPEFMQCYVEINTDVCRSVTDIGTDLGAKVRAVEEAAARNGVRLFWSATHPFSRWNDQRITPNERYYKLAELLRETVIRPVTFGLHVHIGVRSGDAAIGIIGALRSYLPLLLALSANSPFWHGRWTGHHAHRVEVLEGFPTGGLPPRMHSWDEYSELVLRLQSARFIDSHRELWWDARPNADSGTIQVRICDMPPDLPGVLALTALVQCLVHRLSLQAGDGFPESECSCQIVRHNRWRACRFGLGAELVDPITLETVPARAAVERLVAHLRPMACDLGCEGHLESVLELAARPNGAEHQIALFEQTGDLTEMVRRLVGESRLTSSPPCSERPRVAVPPVGNLHRAPLGPTSHAGSPAV